MRPRRLYRPTDVVLARVTTDPGDLELPDDLDFFDGDTVRGPGVQWLGRTWERPEVQAAVHLASPALARQIDHVLGAGQSDDARLRRLTLAVVAYLLRWQRRPTPFGLFAGITMAEVGPAATACFGSADRPVVRADARWLAALTHRLERHPELLPRLSMITNSAGTERGGRFVVPGPSNTGEGLGPLIEVSIRCTRPVRAVLTAAAQPIRFSELAELLNIRFPTASSSTVRALLTDLVERGILLTSLRPPTTVVDGLAYLVAQLHEVGADQLPELATVVTELTEIHQALSRSSAAHFRTVPSNGDVGERMRSLCDGSEHVLATDTAVDGQITLPDAVISEAAEAASALLRLTPTRSALTPGKTSMSGSATDTGRPP